MAATVVASGGRRPSGRRRRRAVNASVAICLALTVLVTMAPLLWLIVTSFKPAGELFVVPPHWWPHAPTLENYRSLWGSSADVSVPVAASFVNTIVIAAASTALALIVGVPAAYAFSRFRFRLTRALLLVILVTRMLPAITLAVPLFILFGHLGLRDTRVGLVIAYTAITLPFVLWMLTAFFEALPGDVIEAAYLDGCTRFSAFVRVALPLAGSGIAATAILTIIYPWNELLLAVVLTSTTASQTMPVALSQFVTEFQVSWGPLSAASVVFTVPVLVFSLFVQRHLVRGLTMGAVKG